LVSRTGSSASRGSALQDLADAATPPTNDERAASGSIAILPKEVQTGQELLQPGEHPFPTKFAIESLMMRIEPSIYLEALLADFHLFGGRLVIRKLDRVEDVMYLPESLVVNCTASGPRLSSTIRRSSR
jgi:hypothetical protein